MSTYPFPKNLKYTLTILFILISFSFLFAQEVSLDEAGNRSSIISRPAPEIKKGAVIFQGGTLAGGLLSQTEENLSGLQKQARLYRSQGLDLQRIGNLEEAKSLYQKAIKLDPLYAVVYNDLGIIYETQSLVDLAEQSYLQAIKIDHNFLSAYSNLALLYENKGQLEKAALYWRKRVELGTSDDPWTQKARQHLEDIDSILGKTKKYDTVSLMKDVVVQKSALIQDDKELAKAYLEKAKQSFQKGDQVIALKQAVDALLLDSSNKEIEEFVEKVQTRLLTR